jgi:hypothetical protein
MRSKIPYHVLRWGVGLLFVYSGAAKIHSLGAFAIVVSDFGILPESLVHPFSACLAGLELATGVGLIIDLRGSLAVIMGLMVLFTAVVTYGIVMGLDIDCGCFGIGDPRVRPTSLAEALLRDGVLIFMCACLYGSRFIRDDHPRRWWRKEA